jgi:type IV secretion system protein VirD4
MKLASQAQPLLLAGVAVLLLGMVVFFWKPLTERFGVPRTIIALFFVYLCLLAEFYNISVRMMLGNKLAFLQSKGIEGILSKEDRVDIVQLGKKKTALFVIISDMDRSQDLMANLFYTQAMQALCRYADKECEDHCLPVPVRFILDDFATNACIPDFDNMISVIRSRGIAVSIILQSLTQLDKMYGPAAARTILNGCDTILYLGGRDLETAAYIGTQVNQTDHMVLNMARDRAWLLRSGQKPRMVRRYDLTSHPRYGMLPEARAAEKKMKAKATAKGKEADVNAG